LEVVKQKLHRKKPLDGCATEEENVNHSDDGDRHNDPHAEGRFLWSVIDLTAVHINDHGFGSIVDFNHRIIVLFVL